MLIPIEICRALTDEQILVKSLENIDYFSCLYTRYEVKMLRYIQRISSCHEEDARDVLQEAFIKIWKNIHEFDQGLKLSSWIYRIVHNETISCWRKKTSYNKDQILSLREEMVKNVEDQTEGGDNHEEKLELIDKVLISLTDKYKDILVLKFLEKKSYEEISDILKIPEGTVATRINRAKKAFSKTAASLHIEF